MLNNGIQDFIKAIGDEGCYALTLCRIAEIYNKTSIFAGDAAVFVERGVSAGYIAKDMTVLDGATFLRLITSRKWTKEYKPAGPPLHPAKPAKTRPTTAKQRKTPSPLAR